MTVDILQNELVILIEWHQPVLLWVPHSVVVTPLSELASVRPGYQAASVLAWYQTAGAGNPSAAVWPGYQSAAERPWYPVVSVVTGEPTGVGRAVVVYSEPQGGACSAPQSVTGCRGEPIQNCQLRRWSGEPLVGRCCLVQEGLYAGYLKIT